jgi:hypothetical protein
MTKIKIFENGTVRDCLKRCLDEGYIPATLKQVWDLRAKGKIPMQWYNTGTFFKEGVIKGDLIIKGGIIYVVEFAYRLSGGGFSTITIPNVYNYSLIDNAIKMGL